MEKSSSSSSSSGWWRRSTSRRLVRWLFSWRTARRALISLAVLITVYALFCTEENIRGKHAWDAYRREAEARGEQLDWKIFIPKPVPDDQNFAASPLIESWFVLNHGTNASKYWQGDNYEQAQNHIPVLQTGRGAIHRHFLDLGAWSKAFALVQDGKITGWQKLPSEKLDAESRAKAAPSVLGALKTNDAIFVELRAASQRPFSRYPIDYSLGDPGEILLPHLNKVRGACRRLELKACAELATGRSADGLGDVKLIFTLSDSLKGEPFIISYLVRIACMQSAIQPIWEGLAEHAWSDAQLQELQTHFESYNFVADLKWPLDGERAGGIDIIDSVQNHGLGALINTFGPGQPMSLDIHIANFFGGIIPSGWWAQEKINYGRLFGFQMEGIYDGANKRVYPGRIQPNHDKFNQAFGRQNPFVMIFVRHQLMSAILLPALEKMSLRAGVAQTATDQALLACALERYRLANGQFPDTLSALTPQFISQPPHDVITGDPYKYRRTADGQFVLYSIGWNEKDDGGTTGRYLFDEQEGDWVWQYPSQH